MDDKTREALEGSIEKWERIVDGTGVDYCAANCPLCQRFRTAGRMNVLCTGCPVADDTGQPGCIDTPYAAWSDHQDAEHYEEDETRVHCAECQVYAESELDYLKGLLPEEVE